MNNDLKIRVTASLNPGKSIGEINTSLRGIEQKIKQLKLKIEVDEKIFNTLKSFTTELNKISDVAKNAGKVIRETLNPDGSKVKETYFNGLTGEFQRTTTEAKKVTQTLENQENVVNDLTGKYKELTNQTIKYNKEAQEIGRNQTFKNGTDTLSVRKDSGGNVTGYTEKVDIEKRKKAEQDYINWWIKAEDDLANQIANGREKNNLQQQQDIRKLEETQAKFINKNIELTEKEKLEQVELTKEIERQLRLYQELQKIKAQDLTRRYGDAVDKKAIGSHLDTVNSVDTSSFQSLKQLKDWQNDVDLGFKKISSSVKSSSSHALTFGEALKTAMVKFPINYSKWE